MQHICKNNNQKDDYDSRLFFYQRALVKTKAFVFLEKLYDMGDD